MRYTPRGRLTGCLSSRQPVDDMGNELFSLIAVNFCITWGGIQLESFNIGMLAISRWFLGIPELDRYKS
jgi:hypothetical protein